MEFVEFEENFGEAAGVVLVGSAEFASDCEGRYGVRGCGRCVEVEEILDGEGV